MSEGTYFIQTNKEKYNFALMAMVYFAMPIKTLGLL